VSPSTTRIWGLWMGLKSFTLAGECHGAGVVSFPLRNDQALRRDPPPRCPTSAGVPAVPTYTREARVLRHHQSRWPGDEPQS
jgi:hypothetical protein